MGGEGKEAVGFWDRIDVLANNAVWARQGLPLEAGSDLVRRIYQSNVFSMLDVTTSVLPYMREQRTGTIVVIGSRTSLRIQAEVRNHGLIRYI